LAERVNRPTGVTIIAILTIIIGIIAIFGGLSLVVFGVFLSAAPISLTENSNTTTITDDMTPQVVQFFGIMAAIVGYYIIFICQMSNHILEKHSSQSNYHTWYDLRKEELSP
jgi:hypothetical protein